MMKRVWAMLLALTMLLALAAFKKPISALSKAGGEAK